jgi:hypothetical protein
MPKVGITLRAVGTALRNFQIAGARSLLQHAPPSYARLAMIPRAFLFTLFFAGSLTFIAPLSASGANYGSMGQEYEQVRRIAMRDARVRDAFAHAYDRLDAKIVETDPALAGYVHAHPSSRYEAMPAPAPHPSPERPVAAEHPRWRPPAPAPTLATPPSAVPAGKTHVVASGETLSSIATHYGVTVAALERLNHIQDARKLRSGQTLVLP